MLPKIIRPQSWIVPIFSIHEQVMDDSRFDMLPFGGGSTFCLGATQPYAYTHLNAHSHAHTDVRVGGDAADHGSQLFQG